MPRPGTACTRLAANENLRIQKVVKDQGGIKGDGVNIHGYNSRSIQPEKWIDKQDFKVQTSQTLL